MSPTSSSGERYHLVATYSVYSPPGPAESGGGGRAKEKRKREGEKEGTRGNTIVSCPDPTHGRRGSGDVRPIPQDALTLITFWREISLHQSLTDDASKPNLLMTRACKPNLLMTQANPTY